MVFHNSIFASLFWNHQRAIDNGRAYHIYLRHENIIFLCFMMLLRSRFPPRITLPEKRVPTHGSWALNPRAEGCVFQITLGLFNVIYRYSHERHVVDGVLVARTLRLCAHAVRDGHALDHVQIVIFHVRPEVRLDVGRGTWRGHAQSPFDLVQTLLKPRPTVLQQWDES